MEKIFEPLQRPATYPKKEEDKCTHTITINKTPAEVYAFCENQQSLESFLKKIKLEFKWDVRLVKNEVKRTIAWHSTEQSAIKTNGHVWFNDAPQELGTVATLVMDYSMPGGKLIELVAKLKGDDIDSVIMTNLKRVKCFLETGEVATTEGQTSGREASEVLH